ISDDFDPFLVLQDAAGRQLAIDDAVGGKFDAQLDFTPLQDGTYKVFAAASAGLGRFTLVIREVTGGFQAVDGKVHIPGKDGLKFEGTVAVTDSRVVLRLQSNARG